MEESVILNVQYTGQSTVVKLKARIWVRVLSIVFYQKNYIMTFSEKNILVKMNNHLFYCRCFQIFYYFMFPEKST